ncbi:MAG TPA: DUF748 domain-containing protein, partial [Caldimonas sp.]|nr:DUF748 domain-containing protein [Caldimonas sp.]
CSLLAWPLAADLSAELAVDWHAGTGAPDVRVAASRVALAKLVLGDAATPVAAAELIEATDVSVDSRARAAAIGRLALRTPQLRVERDADLQWSLPHQGAVAAVATAASAPPQRAAPATSAAAADNSAPWKMALGEFVVERGRVAVADRSESALLALEALDVGIEVRGYALKAPSASFHVSARVTTPAAPDSKAKGTAGSLDVRGDLQEIAGGVPSGVRAALLVRDVPVQMLNRYLATVLDVEVQRALTSFKGDIRWSQAAAGATLAVRGDGTIDDFRSTSASPDRGASSRGLPMTADAANNRQLLSWKTLSMRGIEFAMAPGTATRFNTAETTLNEFFARIVLDESGHLNLQDVGRPAGAASAPSAASAPAAASAATTRTASAPPASSASSPSTIVSFGPIVVVGGRINYNDRFVKPNYNANLSELSGRLESFSSQPPAAGQPPQLANVALRGKVEGTASLEITGKVNPLAKPLALDLQAKVRDLDLPPLSPYTIKYTGYGIERGKMSVDLAYVVQPSGALTASNKIVLNQLVFGEKAEGATTTLPVKMAVALLADSHGVINLDLPVSGSINDPQFSIAGVIGKAIGNILVKAVTAPFTLLASAFGGGSSGERSHIEFAPGVATLDDPSRETLDKVAKALAERPALNVTIIGESRLDKEADAWKKERLAQLVRAEKRRQASGVG